MAEGLSKIVLRKVAEGPAEGLLGPLRKDQNPQNKRAEGAPKQLAKVPK